MPWREVSVMDERREFIIGDAARQHGPRDRCDDGSGLDAADGRGGCAHSRFLTRHCTTARGGAAQSVATVSISSVRHIRLKTRSAGPDRVRRQRIQPERLPAMSSRSSSLK